jgi:hypothetical protein
MRIRKNDLLPWFIQDHGSLPPAYLASCRKFFQELSIKQQATSVRHFVAGQNDPLTPGSSNKRQAVALWKSGNSVLKIDLTEGEKYEYTRSIKNSRRFKQTFKDAGLGLWYTGG